MVIIHNYSLPQLVETEKKIWFIDNEMLKDYDVISLKRVSETGFKFDAKQGKDGGRYDGKGAQYP